MKKHRFSTNGFPWLLTVALTGSMFAGIIRAADQLPSAPSRPVFASGSAMARNAIVYSIKFPGGTAAEFFEFLRTNGFANDNVLFAGKAASVSIPAFSVKNVRLKDVAKSLDLISEGRLSVEVVEKGEESDENIWRIKPSEGASPLRTKTCPMPSFFRNPGAPKRISGIVDSVEQVVARELEHSGRTRENGHAHMLENEKMVVVVGPAAYVEALSSALEAAEKVAAAEAQAAAAK